MSPSLRYLHLSYIPTLVELPSSFQNLHKLAILEIRNCENLETLPTRIYLQSLRFLDLSGCSKLRTFPDISTNIEDLNLSKTAIEEVPPWIEKFTNLHKLEMKGCVNLETLPTGINLPSLECLSLSGCSRFKDFPDISTNITYLNLSQTAIEEVPCWIEKFSWLHVLKMDGCNKLSGEEAPSYFTHRTTKSSSSLTIPLLPSSFSQPFLQFRACFVFNCDDWLPVFEFKGRFWNSFNSFGQAPEFRENVYLHSKGLFVSPSVVPISMIHPDDPSRF
ncbi:hypothetical protein YC2023_019004 [Brassica napus]